MKNISSFNCSLFLFPLILIFLIQKVNGGGLAAETCQKVSQDDPNVSKDFCIWALGSDPGSSKASLEKLGSISFQLDMSNSTSIASTIYELLENSKLDPFTKEALEPCSDLYSGTRYDLQAGLKAFNGGDYATANARASAAMSAPTVCEDGFKKGSPLTKENKDMSQLVAISLGIIKLVARCES